MFGSKVLTAALYPDKGIEIMDEVRPVNIQTQEIETNKIAMLLRLPENDRVKSNVRRISIEGLTPAISHIQVEFWVNSNVKFVIVQIRVISNPEQRNKGGCLSVSTCDRVVDFKTDGRLVANFRGKDELCLVKESRWNFDLPFADTFDHGQVLVKISGNPALISGNNPTPPKMMIYGIADTSMKILIEQLNSCGSLIFVS